MPNKTSGQVWIQIVCNSDGIPKVIFNGVARTLKSYAHQRQTTGTSSDSLELRQFSKWELLLKEKKILPEGVFPLTVLPYGMDNHFYHI